MRGARGSSFARRSANVECSDSASAGTHPPARQPLEHAPVADRREHEVLVPDVALGAEQLDRVEHVVEIVRRLAHAHEHHLATPGAASARARPARRSRRCRAGARGRPAPSCRTRSRPRSRPASRRTARRRGSSTHSTVWPSASSTSSRDEPSAAGCSERNRARPPSSAAIAGEVAAQRRREVRAGAARSAVERQRTRPGAQHVPLVARLRAGGTQAFADLVDAHRQDPGSLAGRGAGTRGDAPSAPRTVQSRRRPSKSRSRSASPA